MNRCVAWPLVLCVASLCGCATLVNGLKQDVPVSVPAGTLITNESGTLLPLERKIREDDTISYVKLTRSHEHTLQFRYQGDELRANLVASMGGGFMLADYLMYIAPVFLDMLTGAWYSFDGIAVHFPTDGNDTKRLSYPYCEVYTGRAPEADTSHALRVRGYCLTLSTGIGAPAFDGPLNEFGIGVGVDLSKDLTVLLNYYGGDAHGGFPASTRLIETSTTYNAIGISVRRRIVRQLYATAGVGWVAYWTNDFHSDLGDSARTPVYYPGVSKSLVGFSLGLGYQGSLGFVELREDLGLPKVPLPDGTRALFAKTTLDLGILFHL